MDWEELKRKPYEQIKSAQDDLLRDFLRSHVYPFSSHYRQLFDQHGIDVKSIKTIEDLTKIPFTTKGDIAPTEEVPDQPLSFILHPTEKLIKKHLPKWEILSMGAKQLLMGKKRVKQSLERQYRPIFLTATTGRTSRPVSFFYSQFDIKNLTEAGKRLLEVFKVPQDEKAINLFPYAPHLAFWQVSLAGLASDILILSTGGGKVVGTQANLRAIARMKPSTILGVPGYVYHLLRCAKEEKIDLSFLRLIILGAEKVTDGLKKGMREIVNACGGSQLRILATYGFTEAKMAWGECRSENGISSGYHLYPDLGVFEVIDPKTEKPLPPNQSGELVYTPLSGRGSIVIRYRTGDYVHGGIMTDPCPCCGSCVPRINTSITRMSNYKDLALSKIKGTLVNLNLFADLLYDSEEIEEWQVVIGKKNNDPHELDEVTLYLCAKDGVDTSKAGKRLRQQLQTDTEVTPNKIIWEPLKDLVKRLKLESSMKESRFLDMRDLDECSETNS